MITSLKQFQEFINKLHAEEGLRLEQQLTDGACYFHCVSAFFDGILDAFVFRQLVMDFIEKHRQEYQPFIENDADGHEQDFDAYVTHMRKRSTYAGQMEAVAVSRMFSMGISVRVDPADPGKRVGLTLDPENDLQMVLVYYGNHYDLATVLVTILILYSSLPNYHLYTSIYTVEHSLTSTITHRNLLRRMRRSRPPRVAPPSTRRGG